MCAVLYAWVWLNQVRWVEKVEKNRIHGDYVDLSEKGLKDQMIKGTRGKIEV